MKHTLIGSLILAAAFAGAETTPEVLSVNLTQNLDTRVVTITYTLDVAPAIVTVDIRTNDVSIGAANITYLSGDVNKLVTGIGSGTTHTITWRPDLSWPDHKITDNSVTATICAWATNAPPDYLVADLLTGTNIHYYTSAESLPDGGLSNAVYRTSRLVMRRIHAAGIQWVMGSIAESGRTENETAHPVTLPNDYYIGIYELTQAQWAVIKDNRPSSFTNECDWAGRPVENVSYEGARGSVASYPYPADPAPASFLGRLRAKTGLNFDLPGEAQWEYACRAGNYEGKWGDGSGLCSTTADDNLNNLGRYKYTGGYISGTTEPTADCDAANGTAVAGSYRPNSWGVYDMHGNVWEWCLDMSKVDITSLGGAVNTNGTSIANNRTLRGGSWSDSARSCRSANRVSYPPSNTSNNVGFRVALGI